MAIRVPTPNVSVVDVSFVTSKSTTVDEVNQLLKDAADGDLNGIMDFCSIELVSGDFNGCPASSTIDAASTLVQGGNHLKILTWYDNEMGYSSRLVDLVNYMFKS